MGSGNQTRDSCTILKKLFFVRNKVLISLVDYTAFVDYAADIPCTVKLSYLVKGKFINSNTVFVYCIVLL